MSLTRPIRTRVVAISGGLAAVALAASGVAYATTPGSPQAAASPVAAVTAATTGSASAGLHRYRHELRQLLRRTVHAQLVVRTKTGWETLDIDRGSLQSVSMTSITIKRPDGPTVTASVSSSTRFRGLPESGLARGDRVILVQTGGTAVVVGARAPRAATGSPAA